MNTGDTVSDPMLHTWNCTATVAWSEAPGGVISSCVAVGHDDSPACGTSENPTLKYAYSPDVSTICSGAKLVNG